MNKYTELNNRIQKEVDALPLHFAFSNKQFAEMLPEMGLTIADYKGKVFKGYGGAIYLKTDSKMIAETFKRHNAEIENARAEDTTGTGYLLDMFRYELANHEYCVTYDLTDTLGCLGLTIEQINESPLMLSALNRALWEY